MTKSYDIIPLRFGRAAEEYVAGDILNYYATTAELLLGEPCSPLDSDSLKSIPMGVEATVNPELAFELLKSRGIKKADLTLIDLAATGDPVLPSHHVVSGLIRAVLDPICLSNQKVAILLAVMPLDGDIALDLLAPYLGKCLVLLARNGASKGLDSFRIDEISKYTSAIDAARSRPIDLLRKKLIRFPGHYKRYNGHSHSHCNEYFFDARLCQAELVDLIDDHISNLEVDVSEVELFFHATVSEWLVNAMSAVAERRDMNAQNIDGLSALPATNKTFALLVLPLVDRGDTVRSLVAFLRDNRPCSEIRIVSILSTEGTEETNGTRPSEGVVVSYLLLVDQIRHMFGACPLCKANIAASDPLNPDPYLKLTAQAFWSIARDVGVGIERDVPGYRGPLSFLPQLQKLDHRNSAYLAYKVYKMLSAQGKLTAEPIILCPDEGGATALGDALETSFNMTVIRIPKIKDSFPDLQIENRLQEVACDARPWEMSVLSLVRIQKILTRLPVVFGKRVREVIIADELRVSGTTHRALGSFAERLGLTVSGYFSMLEVGTGSGTMSLYNLETMDR